MPGLDQLRTTATPHDDRSSRRFPSIWCFIAADCASFGIFFAVFMIDRAQQADQFDLSAQHLNVSLGLLNTLVLITSGWTMALAVQAARRSEWSQVRTLLMATVVVGSGFLFIKIIEWGSEIAAGLTPATDDFFGYYFVLTGVHFFHYLIGMLVLAVLVVRVRQPNRHDSETTRWIESGGLYWHMVDLLWIFLFPMLYLIGARQWPR